MGEQRPGAVLGGWSQFRAGALSASPVTGGDSCPWSYKKPNSQAGRGHTEQTHWPWGAEPGKHEAAPRHQAAASPPEGLHGAQGAHLRQAGQDTRFPRGRCLELPARAGGGQAVLSSRNEAGFRGVQEDRLAEGASSRGLGLSYGREGVPTSGKGRPQPRPAAQGPKQPAVNHSGRGPLFWSPRSPSGKCQARRLSREGARWVLWLRARQSGRLAAWRGAGNCRFQAHTPTV